MIHQLRFAFALVCLLMAAVPTLFILGPVVEARLRPVASIEAVDVRSDVLAIDGEEQPVLAFRTHTVKWRPCRLDLLSFRWLFDHTVEATPVYVREGMQIFQPRSVVRTGEFRSRELVTAIPSVAYNYSEVRFVGTAYYDCHAGWPLSAGFSVPVSIPILH